MFIIEVYACSYCSFEFFYRIIIHNFSFVQVGIAHYMDNMEISIKKQIQNELIRSRNSMIKEIRRELFEKMTHAMKSQGV